MNRNTSRSIAPILIRLNNMNIDTSISIARILDILNSMYNNIGSRSVFLSSEGSAIDEIGGDPMSSSPLAVEERCR